MIRHPAPLTTTFEEARRRRQRMAPVHRYYKRRGGVYVPKRVILRPERWLTTLLDWKIRLRRVLFLTQTLLRDSFTPMSAVRVAPDRWMNGMITAVGLVLTLYFSYHCVAGNHGLFALLDLRERRDVLEAELDLIRSDRAGFEARVDLLDRQRLDPDLLEESARSALGYAHPDDLVILRPTRPPERAPGL